MAPLAMRILRNYRNATPAKFHTINQRVATALTGNEKITESSWAANPTLLSDYLGASKKHDSIHHDALHGSKLVIAERDLLQAQLTTYLDEIALILEAAALRIPDVLLHSGFDLAKERRSHHRVIVQSTSSGASAEQSDQP